MIATGIAAGFDPADVKALVDADGIHTSTVMILRLANGGWTWSVEYDGAPEEVAWRATYQVIDQDTVVATEPCGSVTFNYEVVGDELTLDFIEDCAGAAGDQTGSIAQTILAESAPFTSVAQHADSADESTLAYSSTTFAVPFEVTLPEWVVPEPTAEEPNFVTWEGSDMDRAIRFLAPINLYPPAAMTTGTPSPLPDDYLSYLFSLTDYGATFDDVVETTIDGLPTTVVTATTDRSLDGSLGCQAEGLTAPDCYGVQPDLTLRLAVVEIGDQPLLIWVRDIGGVDAEYDTFDEMLASLHFRPTTQTPTQSASTAPSDSEASTADRRH